MTNKNKHLTYYDRLDIEEGISKGKTFRSIGIELDKDPTTISKEIKRNLQYKDTEVVTKTLDGKLIKANCALLNKPPYVCNNCKLKRRDCGFDKRFYYAKKAQLNYQENLIEPRRAVVLDKEEFYEMDKIISKGVAKGQSFYHIMHSNDLVVSKSSLYRYVNNGYFSIDSVDCKRIVKFRKRNKVNKEAIPKHLKSGRAYINFLDFMNESAMPFHLEMDTVIGNRGGKTLLTFNVSSCNFMFALLLDSNTSSEVSSKLYNLKEKFYQNNIHFSDIFPVVLTDNGSEFSKVEEIEYDFDKNLKLFFCNPNSSWEKGKIEKNHTTLREILPKGSSFDDLTQSDVNIIISHINSLKRKYLNGKSAYEVFSFTFGEHIANLLGIFEIPANEVILKPFLAKEIKDTNK